jgi:hypothetical protein
MSIMLDWLLFVILSQRVQLKRMLWSVVVVRQEPWDWKALYGLECPWHQMPLLTGRNPQVIFYCELYKTTCFTPVIFFIEYPNLLYVICSIAMSIVLVWVRQSVIVVFYLVLFTRCRVINNNKNKTLMK